MSAAAGASDAKAPAKDKDAPITQDHLAVQDLAKLNVAALTPLTHEVISRQATINIGEASVHCSTRARASVWALPGRRSSGIWPAFVPNATTNLQAQCPPVDESLTALTALAVPRRH